jgi:hypothetical protein
VRDQHDVGFRQSVGVQRKPPPKLHDPVAKERIGQQAHAVELDEHRAVTDVANDQ